MNSRKVFKIFIIVACILNFSVETFAQEAPLPNSTDEAADTQPNTALPDNTSNQEPSQNQQTTQDSAMVDTQQPPTISTNKNNVPKKILNMPMQMPSKITTEKNTLGRQDFLKTDPSKTISWKNYFNFPTLMPILGLIGTFFGLLSTWMIYLLNKKQNDPVVISRKNSSIKYIEELYKIKDLLVSGNIRRLDLILDEIITGEGSYIYNNELNKMVLSYLRIIAEINNVPLVETHNRYKIHLNKNGRNDFKPLISGYKMITEDSKCSFMPKVYNETFIKELKNKVAITLSFENKVDLAINILNKNLKK